MDILAYLIFSIINFTEANNRPILCYPLFFLFITGYKMVELARGLADLYIHAGGTRRWDVCAPSAILQARGGVVRTLTGATITFNHHDPNDLEPRAGIFAAASRDLFDTWASTASVLLNNSSS